MGIAMAGFSETEAEHAARTLKTEELIKLFGHVNGKWGEELQKSMNYKAKWRREKARNEMLYLSAYGDELLEQIKRKLNL
jgi:hypothetical protein